MIFSEYILKISIIVEWNKQTRLSVETTYSFSSYRYGGELSNATALIYLNILTTITFFFGIERFYKAVWKQKIHVFWQSVELPPLSSFDTTEDRRIQLEILQKHELLKPVCYLSFHLHVHMLNSTALWRKLHRACNLVTQPMDE